MTEERTLTDNEIRAELRRIDASETVTVSSWEAQFIEDNAFRGLHTALTTGQRIKAMEIIERYRDDA